MRLEELKERARKRRQRSWAGVAVVLACAALVGATSCATRADLRGSLYPYLECQNPGESYSFLQNLLAGGFGAMRMMRGSGRFVPLTISTDQTSVVTIYTLATSPSDKVNVILTIDTGVVLKKGLITGSGWAAGSTITIINNGTICGLGGSGGVGGGGSGYGGSYGGSGANGGQGTDAIGLQWDVVIDNTSGNIFGGGGQGGGGGGIDFSTWTAGGGGGAGQGYYDAYGNTLTYGGARGEENIGFPGGVFASAGANGSFAGAGLGGAGGDGDSGDGLQGGAGGDGAGWGGAGAAGQYGIGSSTTSSPGLGGAAGKAVSKSGFNCVFTGGNNPTQVRGLVA